MESRFLKHSIAAVIAAGLLTQLATPAAAKEQQDYGLLTIQLTGAGGAQRAFVATSSADRKNAAYLVSELGMVTSAEVISARPPKLSEYFRLIVRQQPNFNPPLPWMSLSSVEFYYYAGQAGQPAYLRCRVGTGSHPSHEFWLVVFPAVESLLAPHLLGLSPMRAVLPSLPLTEEPMNPLAVVGLALVTLGTLVLAAAFVTRISSARLSAITKRGLKLGLGG
jgi:hypothetical protein